MIEALQVALWVFSLLAAHCTGVCAYALRLCLQRGFGGGGGQHPPPTSVVLCRTEPARHCAGSAHKARASNTPTMVIGRAGPHVDYTQLLFAWLALTHACCCCLLDMQSLATPPPWQGHAQVPMSVTRPPCQWLVPAAFRAPPLAQPWTPV